MILRKPYAFLIKHFRLIHAILVVFSCYSIYRTKVLLDFFNEYAANMINVMGQDLATILIPAFYTFVPILIIAFTAIILVVMIVKKKPSLFYVFNILVYLFTLIIILSSNSILEAMSRSLVDVRTIRLIRDLIIISFFLQFITTSIIIIRAIGFDIKKFNFKDDLKEMEISDEDREEFEVQLNFDKNKTIRKFRKMKRFFKYTYKENKLLFNLTISGVFLVTTVIIYSNYLMKTPTLTQNVNFSGNGLTMNVLNSYLVNTDYKGKVISKDYYYLLLKIKVKSNGAEKKAIDTATTKITIGNYYYIPLLGYKDKFIDFGQVYQNEKIGNEFEEKILLYQIPKQLINNEIVFSFVNKNSFTDKEGFKSTKIKIKYKDLTGINSNEIFALGEELKFINSILDEYKIKITNYEIKEKFKLQYDYCISKECYKSYEYLTPKLNTNYDKTILKLTGFLETNKNILNNSNLFEFIERFGKICYNVNGVFKTQNFNLESVTSNKVKQSNDFYIEVPKEIEDASNISIIFTIRDRIYEYVLK